MTPETAQSAFSFYTMFQHSDIFMKALVIGLLLTSVWCWTIIFEKAVSFKRMREKMKNFEGQFWSGTSLDTLYNSYAKNPADPLSMIFVGAVKEWRRCLSEKKKTASGFKIQERIDKVMRIIIDKQIDRMETRMIFLASTGSVAPLLGLFGTVWGIIDSFNSIGMTQSTNIAAVAPGVAEALFTTAVGLIAAIPALIGYNKFANDIDRMGGRMETFADELGSILSRQAGETDGDA
jgi:biopolymer transport protein TolQ